MLDFVLIVETTRCTLRGTKRREKDIRYGLQGRQLTRPLRRIVRDKGRELRVRC